MRPLPILDVDQVPGMALGMLPPTKGEKLYAADPSIRDQFSQRVAELESDQRQVRQQAKRELLRLGDRGLPEFPQAIAAAHSGLRFQLIQLQRTLMIRGAKQDLRGSRITGSGTDLKQAVRVLAQQSGSRIELASSVPLQTVAQGRFDWREILFWEAIDSLCAAHSLRWRWGEQGSIVLEPIAMTMGEAATSAQPVVHGGFRIRADRIDLPKGGTNDAEPRIQRINIVMDAEPAIQPWFVAIHDVNFQLSRGGAAAELFTPDARRELDFSGQRAVFAINFMLPAHWSPDKELLRGRVLVHCALRRQELRFPLAEESSRIQFAGLQEVKLASVNRQPGQIRVIMQRLFPADVNQDSHRQGYFHREAWIETKTGQRLKFRTFDLQRASGRLHQIQYEFPAPADPEAELTLVYGLPAVNAIVPVPFEVQWPDAR